MKVVSGFAVVVGLLFVVVWLGIVHPSLAESPNESYAWTANCFGHTSGFARRKDLEAGLSTQGIQAIAITRGRDQAVVLIADTTRLAQQARKGLMAEAVANGLSSEAAQQRILLEGNELIVYVGHLPSAASQTAFDGCVYRIRSNRWAGFTGFDTKSIGRPFMSQSAS